MQNILGMNIKNDFSEDGTLLSYGIHKQEFFAIIKCEQIYILYVMIPIPVCDFCNELEIKNHLDMFEKDTCTYKEFFDDFQSAICGLMKI